jgi:hypothetical protein
MTTNIIQFDSYGKSNVSTVLNKAKDLSDVLILGFDKENNEFYGTSIDNPETILWLLERCKHFLMLNNIKGE